MKQLLTLIKDYVVIPLLLTIAVCIIMLAIYDICGLVDSVELIKAIIDYV